MWRKLVIFGFVLVVGVSLGRVSRGSTRLSGDLPPSTTLGEHLVTILDCHGCHTPWKLGANGPEPDMSRALSGHPAGLEMPEALLPADSPWGWAGAVTNTAFAGPWGTSYAMNLTPHATSGMGIWTERMFVDAIRTGKHMGQSRSIQPPMPWPAYARMTDHELRSIYAYLRTVPPVDNLVPDYREPGSGDDPFVAR